MKKSARETKQEINALILSFVDLCKAIAVLGEASPRALDAVASLGERMSVRLLAAVANEREIKAQSDRSRQNLSLPTRISRTRIPISRRQPKRQGNA